MYKLRSQWLSIEPWRKWCFKVLDTITEHGLGGGSGSYGGADSPEGESPAIEVLKFREKNGYFGQSPDIRDPKNPAVIYRVGQVITTHQWLDPLFTLLVIVSISLCLQNGPTGG